MIILCSLQDIKKHQHLCSEICTCTIWPKKYSPYENLGLFAPTQELVGGFYNWKSKMGDPKWRSYVPVDPEEFTDRYEQLLDDRLVNIGPWCRQQSNRTIALCCFCAFTAEFCHLDVLENWLWKTYGKTVRVERKH
jgi:hypothetical protein